MIPGAAESGQTLSLTPALAAAEAPGSPGSCRSSGSSGHSQGGGKGASP